MVRKCPRRNRETHEQISLEECLIPVRRHGRGEDNKAFPEDIEEESDSLVVSDQRIINQFQRFPSQAVLGNAPSNIGGAHRDFS